MITLFNLWINLVLEKYSNLCVDVVLLRFRLPVIETKLTGRRWLNGIMFKDKKMKLQVLPLSQEAFSALAT